MGTKVVSFSQNIINTLMSASPDDGMKNRRAHPEGSRERLTSPVQRTILKVPSQFDLFCSFHFKFTL